MSRGRLPVLLVIVGLLVAGGIADRAGRASTPHAVALAPGPHAAPASATSSTWYCTGAQARPDGPAVGTVVVANAGSRTLLGTITVVPDNGSPRSVQIFSYAVLIAASVPWNVIAASDVPSPAVKVRPVRVESVRVPWPADSVAA